MADKRVIFNNGQSCPIIGFGTFMPPPVKEVIMTAIDVGYRFFDCAYNYYNEREVGQAIQEKMEQGIIKREDVFVSSKVGLAFNTPGLVEVCLRNSLESLGLDYLDLYLIHWPQTYKEGCDPDTLKDSTKTIPGTVDYVDNWHAMEALVDKGLVKSIGISNFNKRQITRILDAARIKPVVLQIEVHPYLNQVKLIEFCQSHGIQVIAYSPLGSPDRPWARPDDPVLLHDDRLAPLARHCGKNVVQLLIRYAIDRGLVVIPKSAIKYQMEENFNVFDFKLSPDDIQYIGTLENNFRFCTTGDVHHPEYPFHDEY